MGKLIKTVVLDERTEENMSLQYGDFVTCCNCGKTMIVNIGTEKCPKCNKKSLMWESPDNQEISEDFFYGNEDYVLINVENKFKDNYMC